MITTESEVAARENFTFLTYCFTPKGKTASSCRHSECDSCSNEARCMHKVNVFALPVLLNSYKQFQISLYENIF